MAHFNGLDLGRKRLSHKDRLFKVLEGDFLSSLTLLDQITRKFHHGWWICSLAELWRHPLHTREMGSQITNVLRCLYLEACGYQVTVTELVGWEHSMKNELIIARHTGRTNRAAAQRLRALLVEFGLSELLNTRFTLPVDNVVDNQVTC